MSKYRNGFLTVVCCIGTMISTYAQTCDQIKADLATAKAENAYLKKSLKINELVKTQNSDNTEFKLIKVEGDSKAQKVTLTFVLTTNKANWYIMSDVNSMMDIDGNEYKLSSYLIGASSYLGMINLNTGVPIKCSYTFGGILPDVKIVKFFKFGYTHRAGEPFTTEFRDLAINWK